MRTFKTGDAVKVTDNDGEKWLGVVYLPSMLWEHWYIVRPVRKGRYVGKRANYHVHVSEMVKQ